MGSVFTPWPFRPIPAVQPTADPPSVRARAALCLRFAPFCPSRSFPSSASNLSSFGSDLLRVVDGERKRRQTGEWQGLGRPAESGTAPPVKGCAQGACDGSKKLARGMD